MEVGAGVRYLMADGTAAVVGEIEVVDPPRHLVMTWRALYDATMAEEPPSRVEWFLDESDGVTTVTTIHRDLGAEPGHVDQRRHRLDLDPRLDEVAAGDR